MGPTSRRFSQSAVEPRLLLTRDAKPSRKHTCVWGSEYLAQTTCPSVNFLQAQRVNLKPSATSPTSMSFARATAPIPASKSLTPRPTA